MPVLDELQDFSLRMHRFISITSVYVYIQLVQRMLNFIILNEIDIFILTRFFVSLFIRLSERPEYHRPLKAVAWEDGSSHGRTAMVSVKLSRISLK